jgi:branched-chain amino acid transport system substrate-binding protein
MKHFAGLFLVAVLFGSLFSGCGIVPFRSSEPIRIGIIAYLKGDGITITSSGAPTVSGAQLAVRQINEKGGLVIGGRSYLIELVVEGIENDAEQAMSATKKLIEEEKVVAIIGPQYSGDAIAAGEIAEAAGIPLISGTSTNPRTTENRKFVFRATFTDTFQAKALAKLAYTDLQARNVAILYDQTDAYSADVALLFATYFGNEGGMVLASEGFESGNWNIEKQLLSILESESNLVFLPLYPAEAIYAAGALRKLGFTGTFLGSDGWDSATLMNLPAFEGAYSSTTYSANVTSLENEVFTQAYQAIYNTAPLDAAALTYDALQLIFLAIKQEQSFKPQDIRSGLYNISVYTGASGPIDFVKNGDPVKPVSILFYEAGQVEFYKAIQP